MTERKYPETVPQGGWILQIRETGGTVKAADFHSFMLAITDHLRSNAFPVLSWESVLERMDRARSVIG